MFLGTLIATKVLTARSSLADPHNEEGGGASDNGCKNGKGNPNECPCFFPGTQILTPDGESAIENLKVGDLIVTISGEARPIKWVGRRRLERQGAERWDREALPVLISRGAFDGELPSRDLYVSDAHCFLINGTLIPAVSLVNGRSIRKCHSYEADTIEYFHIELDTHDVLFANGAPAETLLGNANRKTMDNFDEYVQLYGPELVTMTPFVPLGSFGGRQDLRSRLRGVLAPVYDRRQPLDIIWDEIARRAERRQAA